MESQNPNGACEWIIADNGCTLPKLQSTLAGLKSKNWVRIIRFDHNTGIARALRRALETATARYVLPVDADDDLYPDALRIVASSIHQHNYPPALYSDEDKIEDTRISQPYFKPDWDPVLLSNSAYIAHLGVMDRKAALHLGVYSDPQVEGSVDWDAFLRFANAGHAVIHIPEVIYHWRIHSQSTAQDDSAKDFIAASQLAALRRFLHAHPRAQHFTVEPSPLFRGGAHFRIRRQPVGSSTSRTVLLGSADAHSAASEIITPHLTGNACDFVCLMDESIQPDDPEWQWEALGIFELFPDTVIVGGRLYNAQHRVIEAGQHFGFAGACGSPNRGRAITDPGYFGQMWKQRSVSAVSAQWLVVNRDFLASTLAHIPPAIPISMLGAWLAAAAARNHKRVVYSPHLSGLASVDFGALIRPEDREAFLTGNSDLIPDRRYYPEPFSLYQPFALCERKFVLN
jgi:hypothetical protein